MAKFRIPTAEATNPVGSNDTPFPAGVWKGTVDEVRVVEVVAGSGSGPQFLFNDGGTTATVASIQLGSNEPALEGQPDVGERKFFDDLFLLAFDGYRWDEPTEGEPTWRLEQTRRRLTNLALALGATETDESGTGPVDGFDEMLRDGSLHGMDVQFEVAHRKAGKGPEKRIFPFIKSYLPLM